jgi:hypothetical protein
MREVPVAFIGSDFVFSGSFSPNGNTDLTVT